MTEPIKLPPLPEARIVSYQTDGAMRSMELRTHSDEDMRDYARAAIEVAKPHIIAEFLERTGQWITNEATRDKAISDAIEADRQARGEPFAWAAYDAATAELVFSDDDMSDSIAWFPLHTTPQPQQQAGEPVAWLCTPDFEGEQFLATTQGAADTLEKDGWSVQPLYDAPQPQQIPEGYKRMPKDTKEFILRAMARNYRNGHSWDHLDSEACEMAADEIRHLRALLAKHEQAQRQNEPQNIHEIIHAHTCAHVWGTETTTPYHQPAKAVCIKCGYKPGTHALNTACEPVEVLSDAELGKAWDSFEAEMARHPTDDELEEFMAQFADEMGHVHDDRHAEAARALLARYGQPAQPNVPEPLKYEGKWKDHYVTGWNNCRAAMLEAAPEPKEPK